jgi:hypothetical protein
MKKTRLAIAYLLVLSYPLKGQDVESVQHQASTPPSDARFEIFQSGPESKWTLKLDRVTGNVDRLVSSKSGNLVWEKTRVLPHPKAVNTVKPHFQIFVSSLPTQSTFLLDTESGATWQFVSKNDGGIWQPIE